MKPTTKATVAILLLGLARPAARADVDLEVANGDTILGTLDPGTEREVIFATVPAGATATFKAKSARGGPLLAAELRQGDVQIAPAVAKGVKLSAKVVVPASGQVSVPITSADTSKTGGYTAKFAWKSLRSKSQAIAMPAAAATAEFTFAADRGATVTITATAARDAAGTPRLLRLDGPGMSVRDLGASDAAAKTDRAGPIVLDATGDYFVAFDDPSGLGGNATIAVKIKPPKASKRRIDVTAAATGAAGEDGALARIVGLDGGDVVIPSDPVAGLGDLVGSAVSIPAGALAAPSVIVIGSAPVLDPAGAFRPAGPTVFFGPEGTMFRSDATVTIPYDPLLAPDTSALRIYTSDSKGRVTEIPPPYTFSGNTVSFAVAHFSRFVAASVPVVAPSLATVLESSNMLDITQGATAGDAASAAYFVDAAGSTVLQARTVTQDSWTNVTYAGGGASTADGTPRLQFQFPSNLRAVDNRFGDLFVASSHRIWRINHGTGQVTRIVGDGTVGDSGDFGPGTAAQLGEVADIHVNVVTGELFIVDSMFDRVRSWDPVSGNIFALAGTGTEDDGAAGQAVLATDLRNPRAITSRANGSIWLAEDNRVRRFSPGGNFTNVAGADDSATGCTTEATGGSAARFSSITGIASLNDDVVVTVAVCHAIYHIRGSDGQVTILAGTPGTSGFSADGPVTAATRVDTPRSVVFSRLQTLMYLELGPNAIRVIREIRLP